MFFDFKKPEVIIGTVVVIIVIIVVLSIVYKLFFDNSSKIESQDKSQDNSQDKSQDKSQNINTIYDLIKYYTSNNTEHFIDNTEIVELYNLLLTKLPNGLKKLISCDDNILDNKDNVYQIIKCIKGQMYHWWMANMYADSQNPDIISIDSINLIMLIIIWLLIMIEDNNNTVKDIMLFDASTNQVTIINEKLKEMFKDINVIDGNNNVMDIMSFHAIFKQYMYKSQDIQKDKCNCKG